MPTETPQSPSLEDVISAALDARLGNAYTSFPGKVLSFDADRRCVDIQPLIKASEPSERDPERVAPLPVLQRVPIVFPGGGGDCLVFPVKAGDQVWVSVSNTDISQWLAGSDAATVDPSSQRTHSLNDAVAFSGARAARGGAAKNPANTTVLYAAALNLGSQTATDNIMRKSDAQFWMNALDAAIVAANTALSTPATAVVAAAAVFTLNLLKTALTTWLVGIDSIVKAD